MQNIARKYVILFFIIVVSVSGCAWIPKPQPQVEETPFQDAVEVVQQAQENFQVMENLGLENTYPQDFGEARDELAKAHAYLEEGRTNEVFLAAMKSLRASRRVLKQYYLDTVAVLAEQAKAEIEKIAEEEPETPLTEALPKLEEVAEYAKRIEHTPQLVAFRKVLDDLKQVMEIMFAVEKKIQETLESDVFFEKGKYELSEKGKDLIKHFDEKLLKGTQEYMRRYPDRPISIAIRTIGYTDQLGFRKGTSLVKKLVAGMENKFPQRQYVQRGFLNQRLSAFRARTINDYLKEILSQAVQEGPLLQIYQQFVGRGEEMPPEIPPPYPTRDPRRRICKVYAIIRFGDIFEIVW